jgi:hypothetical protein
VDAETETDNDDDDVQTSERGAANSMLGNEGSSAGPDEDCGGCGGCGGGSGKFDADEEAWGM